MSKVRALDDQLRGVREAVLRVLEKEEGLVGYKSFGTLEIIDKIGDHLEAHRNRKRRADQSDEAMRDLRLEVDQIKRELKKSSGAPSGGGRRSGSGGDQGLVLEQILRNV
jgi:hypothetical protein